VERVLLDFCPTCAGRLLFFPDDHLAVVRARREDMAKFWVRPGDLPYRARMSARWADELKALREKRWVKLPF
jgi:hypothetical protein